MKSQQEAERAEQQRIKSLVLNYDLQDAGDQDGTDPGFPSASSQFLYWNPNFARGIIRRRPSLPAHNLELGIAGDGHQHNASLHQFANHTSHRGAGQRGQRARRLQLSDVDWYVSVACDRDPTFRAVVRPNEYTGRDITV